MRITKSLFINCREATHLHTAYTDGKLSWFERMQTRIHLAVCSLCRDFYKQSDKLAVLSRKLAESSSSAVGLQDSSKQKMKQLLQDEVIK